jgi:general secretion pathway protein G
MKTFHRSAVRGSRRGFSLAELMVVIVILGLIATIVVPNLLGRLTFAQKEKALMDIGSIESTIETYAALNNGRLPDSLDVLVTPDQNGITLLKGATTVPRDPWGNPYGYEPPSSGRPFRVFSLGKDAAPGGDGENEDVDNYTARNRNNK